ncbi:MAG: lipoate--protein ligase family protein [Acidimicrobiales bacterium]
MTWEVVRRPEHAREFHARPIPEPAERAVWVCEPTGPALVLGSAQREDIVDHQACARAGIDVVRRRSGGGAVLVVPGELLWVDVIVPADDPRWTADVGEAFHWLGEAWQVAFAELGVTTTVHRGGLVRSRWSDLVCFAGLGAGEVLNEAGAKVVGMSQRRTRAAARFQCAALGRWDPDALLELLVVEGRDAAAAELQDAASGAGVDVDTLLNAFLRRLP